VADFVAVVREHVEAEAERQHAERKSGGRVLYGRWMMKGSAGAAVGWLEEIAAANPTASDARLVLLLGERIGREVANRPRWYSKAHLRGVAELALSLTTAPAVVAEAQLCPSCLANNHAHDLPTGACPRCSCPVRFSDGGIVDPDTELASLRRLFGHFRRDGENARSTPFGYSTDDPELARALDVRREECARFGIVPGWRDEVQFAAGWLARAAVES
jgi:hypothetical protein